MKSSSAPRSVGYQVLLTGLLSLNFGLVMFDRNALSFLMPFIQPELGLDNTQVGMLAGALSLTWAAAALGVGALAARVSRKMLLILCTIAFSLCSFASGLASSFAWLLGARLLMGFAEGGIMPVSQSLIAGEVSPRHRGLAMGVAQGLGSSLLGSFVAPVVLVAFATWFGWREAFFLAGLPGLFVALLMAWIILPATSGVAAGSQPRPARTGALREILREPNVLRCVLLGVLLVAYLVVCWTFMPLYLTQLRGFDTSTMGWLMGTLGISATLASTLLPAVSDRVGRRLVMILAPLAGTVLPVAALFYPGSVWGLAALFFFGWCITGAFPLFMATIPSESVAVKQIPLALGICMGVAEILGGVLAPVGAGLAADRYGLTAPLWILLLLALLAFFVALGLRETAPRVLERRLARPLA